MIYILRLLKGFVEFSAEGGFPERFINLCKIRGISLWGVKNDGVKVIAFTTEQEFQELKTPAENSGMMLKVIKKHGLKNFSKRHKWRCGVVFGVVMAFLFWIFMSGYVWEIEILETQGVNVEAFTESLADLGVKIGARKSEIDIIQVQNKLMNEYSELLWVSLNIFGGKVQVEMSEFVEQKEITDTKTPINLVASKKGEIVLVKGYNGVNAVKEGDNVTEGSLLISGVVKNFDGSEYFTRAKGEIFAKTKNNEKLVCKLKNKSEITCEAESRYYLYAFALKIPLGLKTDGGFLTESRKLLKSGKTALPFGIIREDDFKSIGKELEYSTEEAKLSALSEAVKIKREKYNHTELEKVEYSFVEAENKVEINSKINCVEDIAKETPILTEN
ncbi:MAG: sporulation protein YqfD [Clostridia bacterium]|nr:sporulation protein YqfD [Clostridia bacterium]